MSRIAVRDGIVHGAAIAQNQVVACAGCDLVDAAAADGNAVAVAKVQRVVIAIGRVAFGSQSIAVVCECR